jgi:hypothetical protein
MKTLPQVLDSKADAGAFKTQRRGRDSLPATLAARNAARQAEITAIIVGVNT